MSFPRSHRLTSKADYKSLFDQSSNVSRHGLLVLFKPNQKSHARLGLVIRKRVIHSAVLRNRTKRVLRESFKQYQNRLLGLDVIIIPKHQCSKFSKQKLREGIDQLWEKLFIQSS